jgi:hypothetical protein
VPSNLIPALDPTPLPGPPWLFHVLWVVTFLIHLVFVNAVLGGSLLAALAGARKPGARETQAFFVEVNSWAISFAVTFGIAPLLFMQVLFGRFFYTATILVAWAWLGMLVILTAGYYLNYLAKFRLQGGRQAGGVLIPEAVCFLAVAAIQVTVNLLQLQPGRWESVARQAWSALGDPTFVPRYLLCWPTWPCVGRPAGATERRARAWLASASGPRWWRRAFSSSTGSGCSSPCPRTCSGPSCAEAPQPCCH